MTTYTVHLYREMHLVFRDIEAQTPEEAARLTANRSTNDAEFCDDCEGLSYSAHVEPEGGDPSDASELVRLRADGGEVAPASEPVTNAMRAAWAEACVRVFVQHTGCDQRGLPGRPFSAT